MAANLIQSELTDLAKELKQLLQCISETEDKINKCRDNFPLPPTVLELDDREIIDEGLHQLIVLLSCAKLLLANVSKRLEKHKSFTQSNFEPQKQSEHVSQKNVYSRIFHEIKQSDVEAFRHEYNTRIKVKSLPSTQNESEGLDDDPLELVYNMQDCQSKGENPQVQTLICPTLDQGSKFVNITKDLKTKATSNTSTKNNQFTKKLFDGAICKICGRGFNNRVNLDYHRKEVHEKRYAKTCEICGEEFLKTKNYNKHIKKHENPQQTLNPANSASAKINQFFIRQVPRYCYICRKEFKKEENLKMHLLKHTNKTPTAFINNSEVPRIGKTYGARAVAQIHTAACVNDANVFSSSIEASFRVHEKEFSGSDVSRNVEMENLDEEVTIKDESPDYDNCNFLPELDYILP